MALPGLLGRGRVSTAAPAAAQKIMEDPLRIDGEVVTPDVLDRLRGNLTRGGEIGT